MSDRAFRRGVLAAVLLGAALRVAYAYLVVRDEPLIGDALQFHLQANALADGLGYLQPFVLQDTGEARPSADKPPLFIFAEAAISVLGGRTWAWHHLVGIAAGSGTITVIGLLGRRVAGPVAGVLAAAIAAAYPVLIATDGSLRTESLYALLVAASLLLALRARERPGTGRLVALGAVIGLAALTRTEALALVVLLGLPAAGLRGAGIAGLACLVVLAPWLARCWIALDRPVPISTNSGGLLAGANCDDVYAGDLLGQWSYRCLPERLHENEALESARLRDVGIAYAREHAGRLPVVLVARLGRTFEYYRPRQNARLASFFEGRDLRTAQAGVVAYGALALLAVAGALAVRRDRRRLAILLAPVALTVAVTLVSYGFVRFRVAAEPVIVVLAAVGVLAIRERLRARGRPGAVPATA